MAANACDALSLPGQAVTDEKGRIVRQVSLSIVDDEALFPKIMTVVRVAVTQVSFTLTFVQDGDWAKARLVLCGNSLQMFGLELLGEFTQR